MLKAIVDETSHGKYNFMYLRIDFANNSNRANLVEANDLKWREKLGAL